MKMNRTRWVTLVLMSAALTVPAVPAQATPAPSAVAQSACPTGWGSFEKIRSASTTASVKNVRTGRHACFDRMVIDVPGAGAGTGYRVRYVSQLHQDGSGRVIPVAGAAVIEVRAMAPSYHPDTGAPTYPARPGLPLPGVDLTGYRTFRDARFGGSFEGDTQIGLGVRARLPFRVLVLTDRVVVDVAHSWTGR
ncbi:MULTISPECIES: AMIN-like domain-containing (lipo)protein [unclassified Streptomyces]|uniref:AMIN-like domain-containing (lipo)protein n=1 Tax=unclassified Streptomyces TaxID=2593676 RepID=UPI003D73D4CF